MNHHTYLIMGLIIGSFCFSSVVFVALFTPQNMAIVPWIVAALSAMGVALGYFASRGTPPGKDPRCGGSN